jgi:hypothetical protein
MTGKARIDPITSSVVVPSLKLNRTSSNAPTQPQAVPHPPLPFTIMGSRRSITLSSIRIDHRLLIGSIPPPLPPPLTLAPHPHPPRLRPRSVRQTAVFMTRLTTNNPFRQTKQTSIDQHLKSSNPNFSTRLLSAAHLPATLSVIMAMALPLESTYENMLASGDRRWRLG